MAARVQFNQPPVVAALLRVARFFIQHWLAIFNSGMAVFASLPVLAPVLVAIGWIGPANMIYTAYSLTCHQLAYRSWHIFGYQMAYCERNTAIYFAMLIGGLVFARWRSMRPLSLLIFGLMILPIAIDGFTQLFGWRESTWLLRTVTGAMFGFATIWFVYPHLERNINSVAADFA